MKKDSFESKMNRVEEIAAKLEGGQTDIDEAIALFSEGAKLIKELNATLDEAEKKLGNIISGEDEQ